MIKKTEYSDGQTHKNKRKKGELELRAGGQQGHKRPIRVVLVHQRLAETRCAAHK